MYKLKTCSLGASYLRSTCKLKLSCRFIIIEQICILSRLGAFKTYGQYYRKSKSSVMCK